MSNLKLNAEVHIFKSHSLKSNRSKYFGYIEVLDVRIELKKSYNDKDKLIEDLRRNINLLNSLAIKVKWSKYNENKKKDNLKSEEETTDKRARNTQGKKGQSITDIPF